MRKAKYMFASVFAVQSLYLPAAAAQTQEGIQLGQISMLTASTLAVLMVIAIALGFATIYFRRRSDQRAKMYEEAARTLLALASKSPDAYLVVHLDGRLIVSDRLREWLDLPFAPERLSDMRPSETGGGFTESAQDRLVEAIDAAMKGDAARAQLKLRTQNSNLSLAANILRWETPEDQAAILCWFRDITEIEDILAENQAGRGNLQDALHAARGLIEEMPMPVWWREAEEGRLIDANKAYLHAVELQHVSQVIESQVELVGKGEAAAQRALALDAIATETPATREAKLVVEGDRRAYMLSEIPLGQAIIGGVAQDQTSAYELESELSRFAESQNEILNMLSSAVAVFGPEQRLIFFNTAFAELTNLSAAWLAEKPRHTEILERMRENRRLPEQANFPAWKKEQLGAYQSLLEANVETWHLPDDTTLRVVMQPHPFGGLLMILEDVTDKLALERSFNTLITVQRATLNNLQEGVAVFGADGHLQLYNRVFAELWDLESTFLGMYPHVNAIAGECQPLFSSVEDAEALSQTVLKSTIARQATETRIHRSDGSVIDYAAVPLPDGAALLTFSNVTDSARIQRALRDRADALETADRMKTEFVANVSYELRTPLTSILGFAEILSEEFFGKLNDRQKGHVTDIVRSSERLLALIDGILDLAVSEAGQMELDLSDCSVGELLLAAAQPYRENAETKGVHLQVDTDDAAADIFADKRRIQQAVSALIDNALRFTPKGGTIDVRASGGANEVAIKVTDTGTGIATQEQEAIFERFNRGSNVGASKSAGLGLALVRQFVALHGGSVRLKSKPGAGATFTIKLPRNAADILAAE